MELWEGFLWGLFGGIVAELLGWFKLRHLSPEEMPHSFTNRYYWGCTISMVLVGGIVVVAYMRSGVQPNAIMAVNIGASAPLILGSLINQTPPLPPGNID